MECTCKYERSSSAYAMVADGSTIDSTGCPIHCAPEQAVSVRTEYHMEPDGWPCTLAACPPGFFFFENNLCLKSEYGDCESYCESGEMFWGGVQTKADRAKLIVQPVVMNVRQREL